MISEHRPGGRGGIRPTPAAGLKLKGRRHVRTTSGGLSTEAVMELSMCSKMAAEMESKCVLCACGVGLGGGGAAVCVSHHLKMCRARGTLRSAVEAPSPNAHTDLAEARRTGRQRCALTVPP